MSTKGFVSETGFRIRLILILAVAAAGAAVIFGNRIAWRQLSPQNHPLALAFEQGFVLSKIHACTIPHAPAFISSRCAQFDYWMSQELGPDYFLPHTRRVLIIWPIEAALGIAVAGILLLTVRGRRFKKLDEHSPRDWLKTRKLPVVIDAAAAILTLTGLIAAVLTHRRAWLILPVASLAAMALELGRPRRKFRHVRGAKIADADAVVKIARKAYRRADFGGLEIGEIPIPRALEALNLMVCGSPGTGKSVTIARLIATMRERGDRVFAADPRGDYLRRFFRGADLVLNPDDMRAVSWSPIAEIRRATDAAAIARALVPDAEGQAASWHTYAQQLVEGALLHALAENLGNKEVVRLVAFASVDELKEKLHETPAATLLPGVGDSRMFDDARRTAGPYIRALQHLDPNAGKKAFSLRAWARDQADASACWWNYTDAQITAFRTLISCQLDALALGVLEQPDSFDRRTWLIIDELAAIGRIPVLEDYLARARKAGGCAVLGVQTIAQMRRLYGPHSTDAILSCCASTLALAVGDADTAEYMSRLMGEAEISVITRSSGQQDSGAQANIARQLRTERVVLPSELDSHALPPLCGFLKLAGGKLPIAPVRLPIIHYPDVAPRFAQRPDAPPLEPLPVAPAEDEPAAPAESDSTAEQPMPPPRTPAFPLPPAPGETSGPIPPDDLIGKLDAMRRVDWDRAARAQRNDGSAGP